MAWDYNRGGPVGWWKFDECSGNTAHSSNTSYSSSLDGTITIGASGTQTSAGTCSSGTSTEAWNNGATGKFNSSLNFDGTDDYVNVGTSSTLTLTGNFTTSGWVKMASGSTQNYPWIVGKADSNELNGYFLTIYNTGEPYIYTCDATTCNSTYGPTDLRDGSWHHVVGTYNGTVLRVYVDGVSAGSTNTTKNPTSNSSSASIGKSNYSTRYFTGQIDDVRVFNYALTATQVKTLYNGGAVRFGPSTGSP